ADGVAEGRRAVAARVGADGLGHLQEDLFRRAADLLDKLWRVARVVALENLEDAVRVLQRLVARRRPTCLARGAMRVALTSHRLMMPGGGWHILAFVAPRAEVVLAFLRIIAGEDA